MPRFNMHAADAADAADATDAAIISSILRLMNGRASERVSQRREADERTGTERGAEEDGMPSSH